MVLINTIDIFENVVLIPLMENNSEEILNYKNITENKNIQIISSSLENINILGNKKNFYIFYKNNNLLEYLPIHFENIKILKKPYILKPLTLNNGNGIKIDSIIDESSFDNFVIQEFIFGKKEYVSHIYSDKGKIIKVITYEYLSNCEKYIKTSYHQIIKITKIELNNEIMDILEIFINKLNYSGFCNFGYKFDKDGFIKIMEINPRLGGSLMWEMNQSDLIDFIKLTLLSC
jgi:predicted ATP-grasp superfamily ATP-dependent carboligase